MGSFFSSNDSTKQTKVAFVRINGTIKDTDVSLEKMNDALERAFKMFNSSHPVGILLNSPGGAPTQSELIYSRIDSLKRQYNKNVDVFVEDYGASGGYMIACAGTHIYAAPTSLVGSIGVVASSIGIKGLAEKIGINNRTFTAGEQKVMLDPFSDVTPEQKEVIIDLMADIHTEFKNIVVNSRRGRLSQNHDLLFSGRVWTGKKAAQLGLVDGLGNYIDILKEKYGADVEIKEVKIKKGLIGSLMSVLGVSIGSSIAENFGARIESGGFTLH
jgi:signal peptide peptidase SppA